MTDPRKQRIARTLNAVSGRSTSVHGTIIQPLFSGDSHIEIPGVIDRQVFIHHAAPDG